MGYPVKLLQTGISYRREFAGIVPEVEEREACRFNGYQWENWQDLPRYERVDGVAYFRIRKAIEMHQQDAQDRETQRQMKAARKKK